MSYIFENMYVLLIQWRVHFNLNVFFFLIFFFEFWFSIVKQVNHAMIYDRKENSFEFFRYSEIFPRECNAIDSAASSIMKLIKEILRTGWIIQGRDNILSAASAKNMTSKNEKNSTTTFPKRLTLNSHYLPFRRNCVSVY